jgi:pyrroloquinoline-quinone synthase
MMKEGFDTNATSFRGELLAILRENPYRDPLLAAIRDGRIGRDAVKQWTLQAMLVVRQFTRFISAIHTNCPRQDGRQLLAENLWEEHGRGLPGRDHVSLIIRLARALGATEDEINNVQPLPETSAYIDQCFRITREGSFVEGMTAIGIGIEYYMPAFFGTLAGLLRERFDLSSTEVEYLLVHVAEDEEHARRSLEVIEKYADTDAEMERAKTALREMLTVKHRFAQAVFASCSFVS